MMRRIEGLETEITILKAVVAEKSSGKDNTLHTPNKCLRGNIIVSDESDNDRLSDDKAVESLTVNPKRQFLVKVDVHKDINGNSQHNKSDKISGFRHTKEQKKQILKRKKHARPIHIIQEEMDTRKQKIEPEYSTHLVYVGRLQSETKECDIRDHLTGNGVPEEDIADVIQLRTRNRSQTSFVFQ